MSVAANQVTRRSEGLRVSGPVAETTILYGGTLAFTNASGYLDDDTASGVNTFAGVVIDEVDNSAGVNGALSAELHNGGLFLLVGAGFSQATFGQPIYASDNYTVTATADGNTHIGRCVGYVSSTRIWVELHGYVPIPEAFSLADAAPLSLGDGLDAQLLWSTADADNHTTVLALGDANQSLHLTDKGAKGTDWAIAADTHPTLYIHSNTTPATDYLKIGAHDGAAAEIDVVGGGTLNFKIGGNIEALLTDGALQVNGAPSHGGMLALDSGGADKPGVLRMATGEAEGSNFYLWVDSNGNLRIASALPTDEDGDGVVVGDQTSGE